MNIFWKNMKGSQGYKPCEQFQEKYEKFTRLQPCEQFKEKYDKFTRLYIALRTFSGKI